MGQPPNDLGSYRLQDKDNYFELHMSVKLKGLGWRAGDPVTQFLLQDQPRQSVLEPVDAVHIGLRNERIYSQDVLRKLPDLGARFMFCDHCGMRTEQNQVYGSGPTGGRYRYSVCKRCGWRCSLEDLDRNHEED